MENPSMADKLSYEELEQRVQELEFLELKRKKSENELDKFFNLSIDMLCIADMEGYFKVVNDSFVKNLGYSKKELYRHPFFHFVHPDDLDSTKTAVSKLSHGEPIAYFENRYRCKDGSYKWLAWTSMPVAKEEITYAVARDITSIKESDDSLRKAHSDLEQHVKERTAELNETNLKLENILDTSIPICITNTDYQIVLTNDSYKDIFTLNEQNNPPMKCYESRPGESCQTDACPMQIILSGEEKVVFESTKANAYDRKQYFIVTAQPFLNNKGQFEGIIECFQDITDRKNIEKALQESEDR